ncbi:TniB family NTP-binding protein [Paucibacter sp. TC2R-5]|uniref:TniB family NTP-binding protein n=1 Tax=Paucibacter sp. TC2R-5 TaxID=2893555 RepID=UPI0021E4EF03|nr:TniB family NTP-binding protein [Paucibacter sp. TC2R-5]MCV2360403.1 TniB family NTP-binding protein [Paucibacter sp. TC2R-5]
MKKASFRFSELPEFDVQQCRERRMFSYSKAAVSVAQRVDNVYVNHSSFRTAVEALDRAYQLAGEFSQPEGVIVAGDGMGCSTLGKYFVSTLPAGGLFDSQTSVIAIKLNSSPTGGSLVEGILSELKYPFPTVGADRLFKKTEILVSALKQRRVRMLLIDDAELLLSQRALCRDDRIGTTCSALLRHLMDEVPLAVVLLGAVSKEQILRIDQKFASRLNAVAKLEPFGLTPEWTAFLQAFVKQCDDIDLKFLTATEEVLRLNGVTQGSLRVFKHLVVEAVLVAMDGDARVVNQAHLALAYSRAFRGSAEKNPYAA